MNLVQLQAAGAFVEAEPVKVPVEWARKKAGADVVDKFDVWVRLRSFGLFERVASLGADRSRSAQMLSECILLGEEREAMTYEQAYQLDPDLAFVLVEAVRGANAPKG